MGQAPGMPIESVHCKPWKMSSVSDSSIRKSYPSRPSRDSWAMQIL